MPSIPALSYSPMWHLLSCASKNSFLHPVLFNPLNEHRILLSSPAAACVLSSSFNSFPPLPDSMNCSSWKQLTNLSPLLPQLLIRVHQKLILLLAPRLLLDAWLEAVIPSIPALLSSPIWQLLPGQASKNFFLPLVLFHPLHKDRILLRSPEAPFPMLSL